MSKKCRKKSVCAVVVMVAMLCISGCGSGKIKSDKVLRVGVVTYTQDDPFINALADKLKENLKSNGNRRYEDYRICKKWK